MSKLKTTFDKLFVSNQHTFFSVARACMHAPTDRREIGLYFVGLVFSAGLGIGTTFDTQGLRLNLDGLHCGYTYLLLSCHDPLPALHVSSTTGLGADAAALPEELEEHIEFW